MAGHKLDYTDRKILNILQANAKITNAQLAKEIDLSPAPTLERVKKLENLGFIKSYHASLDVHKLGLGVTTFLSVKLVKYNKESIKQFIDQINKIDEVIECHFVTGGSHFLMRVVTTDITAYQQLLLDKFSVIEEIDNMQSMIVLTTAKDNKVLPIPN